MPQIKRNGYNQADLVDFLRRLRNSFVTYSVSTVPAWVPATAPADIRIAAAALNMVVFVDGVMVIKATADPNIDLPGAFGLVNTAANQSTVVLVQINAAGTFSLKQGPVVAGTASDTIQTLPVPVPDAGVAVVAYIVIAGTAHTWGTTAITAGMLKDGDPYMVPGVNGNGGLES